MPSYHLRYSLLSIILIIVTFRAIAQNPEESPRAKYHNAVAESLKPVIEKLCETAPEKDQTVCRKIEYQVTDHGESFGTTAGSRVDNGQLYVEIPLMYVRELLLTNRGEVLAFYKYISQQDYINYLQYVAKTNRDNNERLKGGKDPIEIQTPEEFAKLTSEIRNKIENDSNIYSGNKNAYEASIAFTIAHEIGHHVFGHKPANCILTCSGLKRTLAQERQADAWAIEAVLRIGQPPSGGLLPLYLSLISDKADPKAVCSPHHPTDAERILTFQKATLRNLDKLTGIMQRTGRSPDEVRQQLQDSIRRYQMEIDQNPVVPCDSPRSEVKTTQKKKKG